MTCQPATATKMAASSCCVEVGKPCERPRWVDGRGRSPPSPSHSPRNSHRRRPRCTNVLASVEAAQNIFAFDTSTFHQIYSKLHADWRLIRIKYSNGQSAICASSLSHKNSFEFPSRWPNVFDNKRNI